MDKYYKNFARNRKLVIIKDIGDLNMQFISQNRLFLVENLCAPTIRRKLISIPLFDISQT